MAKPDNLADNVEHLQQSIQNTQQNLNVAEDYLMFASETVAGSGKKSKRSTNVLQKCHCGSVLRISLKDTGAQIWNRFLFGYVSLVAVERGRTVGVLDSVNAVQLLLVVNKTKKVCRCVQPRNITQCFSLRIVVLSVNQFMLYMSICSIFYQCICTINSRFNAI